MSNTCFLQKEKRYKDKLCYCKDNADGWRSDGGRRLIPITTNTTMEWEEEDKTRGIKEREGTVILLSSWKRRIRQEESTNEGRKWDAVQDAISLR